MSPLRATLALAVLFAGGCSNDPPPPPPLPNSAEFDLVALQAEATASCKCKASGDGRDCGSTYQKQKAAIEKRIADAGHDLAASMGTACTPISSGLDCFEFADGEKCVSTGYSVVGTDHLLCTEEEAQALESFAKTYSDGGRDYSEAIEQAYRDVLSGKRPAKPSDGCA